VPSSYTAQRIITAARDRHPAFDEQAHPDQVCLRWLSTFQQTLAQRIQLLDDQALVTTLVATFPLPNFLLGITLPPHQYVGLAQAILKQDPSTVEPVTMVPWDHRFDRTYPFPAATLTGSGGLLLLGKEQDWVQYSAVAVRYAPTLTPLVSLNDTFDLPDSAEAVLVAGLAGFLAGRAAAFGEKVDMRFFAAEASQASQALMDQVAMRRRAESDYVREVW
jgi:hypothetical protein